MEQHFLYEALPVRVNTDEINQIWFAGIDVCNILGYADSYQKIKSLDPDEYKLDRIIDGQGKQKETLTVNEFGVYSLILTSTKPEAKAFKRWVTHEVLPAIRKAGIYTKEEAREYEHTVQNLSARLTDLKDQKQSLQGQLRSIRTEIEAVTAELMHVIRTDYRQLKLKFPQE